MKEKPIRLDRLLSNLGYGSRKEMTMAIKNGWLEIENERVTNPSQTIDLSLVRNGLVVFDGEVLDPPAPLTIMLHKPSGFTCSQKDSGHLVYDLLPARWKHRNPILSPIGRLDKYSTGQLLFTDDGDLLHRIIHPKSHALKYYHVTLREPLQGNEADLFASGTFTLKDDDTPLKPARWTADSTNSGSMILSEGRYHQIRRMFETIGNEVIKLHRLQTGNLPLGDLVEGTWKILSQDDINTVFASK